MAIRVTWQRCRPRCGPRPAQEGTAAAVSAHAGRLLQQGAGRHGHRRYAEHLSLSRARPGQGAALRDRRRPRGLHLVRRGESVQEGGMARLESAGADDRAPALPSALHGRRRRQSARRARALSRRHHLSHSRHQSAVHHRDLRLLGLHPAHQRGHHGPAFPRQGRHARGGAAGQGTGGRRDDGAWFVRRDGVPRQAARRSIKFGSASKATTPREIAARLRDIDALVSQGQPLADATRQAGISTATYHRWRQELGAQNTEPAKRPAESAQDAPKRVVEGEAGAVREPAAPASKGHQDSAGFEE